MVSQGSYPDWQPLIFPLTAKWLRHTLFPGDQVGTARSGKPQAWLKAKNTHVRQRMGIFGF